MDTLSELLDLVPAPYRDTAITFDRSWDEVENSLGLQLPEDYKAICEVYGPGQFAQYIGLLDLRRDANFRIVMRRVNALAESQKEFPQFNPPFPAYPAENGILLLGQTEVNSGIYWRRTPQGESVILTDVDDTEFYLRYDMKISAFLLQWFRGEIRPSHFPGVEEANEEDRLIPEKDRRFYPLE